MQFIQNGPDVPDALLQAHEEEKVIFFCGAGISYPAGLPGFGGLVEGIYRALGTVPNQVEKRSLERSQYDAALDLLEKRLPGQRAAMRKVLRELLKPKFRRKGATETHAALLQLARTRDDVVRLVTTNFDRIFQRLMDRHKPAIPGFAAPLLPIPKKSRWHGVVYLHGLLPEENDIRALDKLVLTSGDFGLAYLTERWASQFVSELFQNYTVCFVGYSINDPVLRYMMDALAADRRLGEATPQAYAFGDYRLDQEEAKRIEWEAKGVTPILYEVPSKKLGHSALHRTLKAWADTYRDGVQGKERIVVQHAVTKPAASTKQDDFVGRMLWALSHESGVPAQRFADFDPVPSLDWLEAMSEHRYRHSDLSRFGVSPNSQQDEKLAFSLVRRPTPYVRAPWMCLVSNGIEKSSLDNVMLQLGRWLRRHLNDPKLILWLAQSGPILHEGFAWIIETEIEKLTRYEREKNNAELDRIRANAPNAIPSRSMRILWRLLLTGRVQSAWHNHDIYRWKSRLDREGFTSMLRLELRELLSPKILLRKPFQWDDGEDKGDAERPRDLVDWELVLSVEHAYSFFKEFSQSETWKAVLSSVIDDVQQLLRDALDLQNELDETGALQDRSYWDMPSIGPHWQNRGVHDWVVLIEILRDAWLSVYERQISAARRIVEAWLTFPYPTFRRLALFAAAHKGLTPNGEWVDWLLDSDGWWLWSVQTQREVMRLLVLQGPELLDEPRSRLEEGILVGPPRQMFKSDLTVERWQRIVDEMMWLRLAKLASQGAGLGKRASSKLTELSTKYPDWKLASNERDEFSHWMSGTGDPDYEERRNIERAPDKRRELAQWLLEYEPKGFFEEHDWPDKCRANFPVALCALNDLACKNVWPAERWEDALQAWSDEKFLARSWRYAGPIVGRMPNEVLQTIVHSASWWLQNVAKKLDRHHPIFLELCHRILELHLEDDTETDQPVNHAINHPIGHVTQALLNFWFLDQLEDNQGIRDDLTPIFSRLCNVEIKRFRHARVLLASNAIALFRVDRAWAEENLIPLFNWQTSKSEAQAAWEGFLWSPRLFRPLITAFKPSFLETAHHYRLLGEHSRQYAIFLTYAALEQADTFTTDELHSTFSALPPDGLTECAQALVHSLESAGAQVEEHWTNRILPFWQTIWPKSLELLSKPLAEQLARLAVAARNEFPSALSTIEDWLQPVEHPFFIIHRLQQSGLCPKFPQPSLRLLSLVVGSQPWASKELGNCLDSIADVWPQARQNADFRRLSDYVRAG